MWPKMRQEGCIHGRFQPFHNEHLEYLVAAMTHVDYLWIGITNPDIELFETKSKIDNRQSKLANPLTYYERVKLISSVLQSENIPCHKYGFMPFPIETPQRIHQFIPRSVICYTTIREEWNFKKIDRLKAEGFEVVSLWTNLSDKTISSTKIRELILRENDDWRSMLKESAVKYLLEINIYSRLHSISEVID